MHQRLRSPLRLASLAAATTLAVCGVRGPPKPPSAQAAAPCAAPVDAPQAAPASCTAAPAQAADGGTP
jgi:hypothetical protein